MGGLRVDRLKKLQEITSLEKDILDRERIISDFLQYGILDKKSAIEKIEELQRNDIDIVIATNLKQQQVGGINLNNANDSTIIDNLKFQIDLLKGKLAAKVLDDKGEH